jgi:hypothetical protein
MGKKKWSKEDLEARARMRCNAEHTRQLAEKRLEVDRERAEREQKSA